MEIRIRTERDVEVFAISGRMTIADGAEPLSRRFERSLDEGRRKFVFDLRRLLFMDSASIGEMVACLKRAREQSGSIKLLVPKGGRIDQVIRLTAMHRIFEVFYDEAASGLAEPPSTPPD